MDRVAWQTTVHGVAKSQTRLFLLSFFLLWTIVNNSVELLAHVLWCMCVCVCVCVCVIFPMTHTQEWDDWVIDFHCL